MDSYSDQSAILDELIFQLASFKQMKEDGVVTEDELARKKERVIAFLNIVGDKSVNEKIGLIKEILAEVKRQQASTSVNKQVEHDRKEKLFVQKGWLIALLKRFDKVPSPDLIDQTTQIFWEIGISVVSQKKSPISTFLNNLIVMRYAISAVVISFLISLAFIIQENSPSSIFDDMDLFVKIAIFDKPDNLKTDSVLWFDVAYDKDTVFSYNDDDIKVWKLITDRSALFEFLKLVESINSYKCVFLDITFDERDKTKYDTLLLSQIESMRLKKGYKSVIIARSPVDIFFDKRFDDYALSNDYFYSDINSYYIRDIYKDRQDYGSVALGLYNITHSPENNLEPNRIFNNPLSKKDDDDAHFYSIFTCKNHFFRNNPILKIPQLYRDRDYHLGKRFLSESKQLTTDSLSKLFKNKILIVGDFVNDRHLTYAGEVSGSYLTYLAYKELAEGRGLISWRLLIGLFFLYTIWIYLLLDKRLGEWIKEKTNRINKKNEIGHVIITTIGILVKYVTIGGVLYGISWVLYRKGYMYNMSIPVITISLIALIISTYRHYSYKR